MATLSAERCQKIADISHQLTVPSVKKNKTTPGLARKPKSRVAPPTKVSTTSIEVLSSGDEDGAASSFASTHRDWPNRMVLGVGEELPCVAFLSCYPGRWYLPAAIPAYVVQPEFYPPLLAGLVLLTIPTPPVRTLPSTVTKRGIVDNTTTTSENFTLLCYQG